MSKSILNVNLLFPLQTGENYREKEVRVKRKRRLHNLVELYNEHKREKAKPNKEQESRRGLCETEGVRNRERRRALDGENNESLVNFSILIHGSDG